MSTDDVNIIRAYMLFLAAMKFAYEKACTCAHVTKNAFMNNNDQLNITHTILF